MKRSISVSLVVMCVFYTYGCADSPETEPGDVYQREGLTERGLGGMNLLGWFVPESWLNSLFYQHPARDILSLYEQGLVENIEQHLDTFVVEQDLRGLATEGFQLVRVSLGYWDIVGETHAAPHLDRIAQLLDWAAAARLQVLLDLHAVPGSQNGYEHSGRVGPIRWYEPENLRRTLEALAILAQHFGQHPALWGIQPVNEPNVVDVQILMDFYQRAYATLRAFSDCWITFSDGYVQLHQDSIWFDFFKLRASRWRKVALDVHLYLAFYPHMDEEQMMHLTAEWSDVIDRYQQVVPVVIGEWSGGLPLDSRDKHTLTKKFIRRQQEIFAKTLAHFYATYKGDYDVGIWDYSRHKNLIQPAVL